MNIDLVIRHVRARTLQRKRRPLLQAIVGIEISFKEVQRKFKLGQNRSAADRAAVVSRLEATGSVSDSALTGLIKGK